jgi:hypothetical protein
VAALLLILLAGPASGDGSFLDRVEGDRAVLVERGRTRAVPRCALVGRPREGTAIHRCASDPRATAALRRRLRREAARIPWRAE